MALLRSLAGRGDAKAERQIGHILLRGLFMQPKNPVEAVRWLNSAISDGYRNPKRTYGPTAPKTLLGKLYLKGDEGVDRDSPRGIRLLTEASADGDHWAQYILGRHYVNDAEASEKTLQEGVRLLMQTHATDPFGSAKEHLGYCYLHGKGVLQDVREGARLMGQRHPMTENLKTVEG